MNVSQAVARVYAEALLDMAAQKGDLARVVDDLTAVRELFDNDETFRTFFGSPRIDRELKKKTLVEAFAGKLDRPVMGLLSVLVDKQRELVFDNIVDEFNRFRDLREGVLHADVSSAKALDAETLAQITQRLEGATGKKVRVHEKVDASLIGGIVLKLGDKVIDGSLRRRLHGLRRKLVNMD